MKAIKKIEEKDLATPKELTDILNNNFEELDGRTKQMLKKAENIETEIKGINSSIKSINADIKEIKKELSGEINGLRKEVVSFKKETNFKLDAIMRYLGLDPDKDLLTEE